MVRNMELWIAFALLHIPLALLMQKFAFVSTATALMAGFIGVLLAFDHKNSHRVATVAAYIAGAEVLWRITGAEVAWEYGKYAIAVIFILAVLTQRPAPRMGSGLLYLLVLLPSTALTLFNAPRAQASYQIEFNLSGPVALAACLWFFSEKSLDRKQALQITLAILVPLIGIMTLAAAGTMQSGPIAFSSFDSIEETSAGYRPNQVSLILGLGALLCFLALLVLHPTPITRAYLAAVMLITLAQTALTFSRGGIYLFAAGSLAAVLFSLKERRTRQAAVVVLALLFFAGQFVIWPRLAEFTGNAIIGRFQNLDTSGRPELIRAEIAAWLAHPILGAGPGMLDIVRGQAAQVSALPSHNEFSRMLAEHGLPGLAGIVILAVISWQGLRRAGANGARAWAFGLWVWVVGSFSYIAFRTAAPALLLGVCLSRLEFSTPEHAELPMRAGSPEITPHSQNLKASAGP